MRPLRCFAMFALVVCSFAGRAGAAGVSAPPPDLLGHWPFDNGSDSTVGGWTGMPNDGARTGQPGAVVGGGCYQNEAGAGFIQTNLLSLDANKPFTAAVWFRTDPGAGADEALFGWGGSGFNGHWDFGIKNGNLHFLLERNSTTMTMPSPLNDGAWHHLMVSFAPPSSGPNTRHATVYLNGKSLGSPADAVAYHTWTKSGIRIGTGFQRTLVAGGPPARDFHGRLDDFAMFGTALSASDAALIHGLAKHAGTSVAEIQPARYLAKVPMGAVAAIDGRLWTKVAGLAGTTGDFGGSIATGDAWIATDSEGGGIRLLAAEPPLAGNPLSIEQVPATITIRSGDRASFPFQLRNTGAIPVDWKLRVVDPTGDDSGLDSVLGRFVRNSPQLIGSLPAQTDFAGGVTGTQLDGTPFNGGNILMTSVGGPLGYSDAALASSSAVGTDGRYFTLKLPGLMLFGGDLDGPAWFESGGRTFSNTKAESQVIDLTHAGRAWKAFAVRRAGWLGDNVVNQLFLIDDANAHLSPLSSFSDTAMNVRVNFSGKRRIFSAVFTVTPSGDQRWSPFETLSRTILELLSEVPTGMAIQPAAGNLTGGGTIPPALEVDALALLPGSHPLAIDAQPAGGGAEPVRAPFTLVVEEPALRFASPVIERAGIFGGPSETVLLGIESTTGSEQAWTASLVAGGSWVTLAGDSGTTPQGVSLRLTPPATGIAGIYRATLEVRSGTSTFLVPIMYVLEGWNPIALVADPLRDNAYVLNNSDFGGVVAVISQSRRNVRKFIRVGTRPSDIAFSPDGSAVFVLCVHRPEIVRIDAETLETTAFREVPGTPFRAGASSWPSARLAALPNGRIVYTDTGNSPPIHLFDFEPGVLLSTLRPADMPGVPSVATGFADVWFDPHGGDLYFTRRTTFSGGFPRIGRIETANDTLRFAEEWIAAGSQTIVPSPRIFSDLDGRYFMAARMWFPRAEMSNGKILYDSHVSGISAYGDLVMTQYAVHDATNGQKLADLPRQTELAMFTNNQAGVMYYAGSGQFDYWSLPAAIRPPAVAIRPEPPNGGALEQGQAVLRWSSLPLVDGYRIYLGTDPAAVAAAQPGSTLDRGVVTTNSFTMDPVPTSGTLHWRVDAIRGGTVVPGSVFSFSVAPFKVTPRAISIVAPHGALPQRVTLAATDGDDNPVAWSASSTSSWIKLPQASGGSGDPLRVDLDPAGLALGGHAGTLRVTGAGLTIEIPVTLQLFEVNLHRLRADPNRPVVYGLQAGESNGLPGYLIPIDAATGKYISAMPLEKYADDFAVHPIEDRIYVPLHGEKRIQRFDLATGGQLPALELSASFWRVSSVVPGAQGRLFLDLRSTSSFPSSAAHLIDTASGNSVAAIPLGYSTSDDGTLASAPGGGVIYRKAGNRIQRVDVSTEVPVLLESGDSTSSVTSTWRQVSLAVSRDGSRVVSDSTILTADLKRIASVEFNAHAITGDGQVVAGPSGVYWADTGFKAASLPITYTQDSDNGSRVVFSSDDRFVVIWDQPNKRMLSIPLASLVSLPGPQPRPGQQLAASPAELSWGAVTGVFEYQVFLGTSQAAVNSAGIGSPLRIGTSQTNTLVLNQPLAPGYRYYWRVDALTAGGSIKGVVHFFDLPFQSSGNPIVQPGPLAYYGADFGASLAPGPDGLMVGHAPSVKWFEFDWLTGAHRYAQELRDGDAYSSYSFTTPVAAGPDLMVAGNPRFAEPVANAGAAFIHRRGADGVWFRTHRLPSPPDGSTSSFGNRLGYDAGQLLIQQGSSWETSGRVFPYFEWPDWRRGPELVPNPRETNDFFGAAIALDGTRALVGAPGTGTGYNRKGSAFIFEYDAATRQWPQRARLQPSQGASWDYAGMSVALAGNHAALGSGNQSSPFGSKKVHVFNRRSTTSWVQTATLNDPDPVPNIGFDSSFGAALAIHGDILFVSSPYAVWRGQRGGVVYPYRYNGSSWDVLAPIVPPPGGLQFGAAMAVHHGWLFISQFMESTSNAKPDLIHAYRIADTVNHRPLFVTRPPVQVVSGRVTGIEIEAMDPDGNAGLVFRPANLPPGLTLQDLGNGRARVAGTPTDAAGTERWLRIAVADAQGAEAVQTSLVRLLAADDLPVIGGLPASVGIADGEELVLSPTIGGSGPFTWQWKRNGIDLPDQTKASLILTDPGLAGSGSYSVTVTNAVGSVTSAGVSVAVRPADRFAGDWTSYGSGNNHDGFQAAVLGRHRFQLAWQAPAQTGTGLNPVSIASGMVFVTPRHANNPMQARAYDLASGTLAWSHQFASAAALNSPTWHNGRVYLQRSATSNSEMWCLDANTGTPLWNTPYSSSSANQGTPVADASGIYAAAGGYSGVYGFNHDGPQRFRRNWSDHNPWMPTLAYGRLFTWDGSLLTELDVLTGEVIWKLDRLKQSKVNSAPVVRGTKAYLLGSDAALCVDIDTRRADWQIPLQFTGSPALGRDRWFALAGTFVVARSLEDGSQIAQYPTGAPSNRPLQGQPLVLNDHLIASNIDRTFVFDLATGGLVQTIPHGGHLAYSAGHLVIAGNDNILRSYLANAAPEFAPSMPEAIGAGDAAADLVMSLAAHVIEADPGDSLTWSIVSVSRPELFRSLEIHALSGDLSVIYNPWKSGSAEVVVAVTDTAGNATEHTLTFTVPAHPEPRLELSATLRLNRQSGLYEQAVTVTNRGAREIAGFDLVISGLPSGVRVQNASATDGGKWIIRHRQPLAAGASVTLLIEYFTPVRGTTIQPKVGVVGVDEPEGHPAAGGDGLAVQRCQPMPDGGMLVEFAATPGALYEIQYSNDGTTWKASPVQVVAAGNRVQWIDNGPPRTETPPSQQPCRFYRVRRVSEP